MMASIERIDDCLRIAGESVSTTLPAQAAVYGAGSMGRRVAQALQARGVTVHALLDRSRSGTDAASGLALVHPDAWFASPQAASAAVVMGIHNPAHDSEAIIRQLEASGARVISLVELVNILGESLPGTYWLAPREVYRRCADAIRRAESRLEDHESRVLYRAVLAARLTGRSAEPIVPERDAYFPRHAALLPQNVRLIDCGAYVGDTLRMLAQRDVEFGQSVAMEPDASNYAQLVAAVRELQLPVLCLPCAVDAGHRVASYAATGDGASRLSDAGGTTVVCLGIDQALQGHVPNVIKMDIEGAEPAALEGARETIARHRPLLAISVYHEPEHLWSILNQIDGWGLGYRFTLHAHSYNTFDIVLYARP